MAKEFEYWLDKTPQTEAEAIDDLIVLQRVLKLLIAGEFVTKEKVEKARELATTLK